jgi:hypothetical protein
MERYLAKLDEDQPQRSAEEYLGAFSESLKLILHQNPVDHLGNAVLLAAKTALRLKAALPHVQEHEIARRLQTLARSIRLQQIMGDLTPEEKNMLKLHPPNRGRAARQPALVPGGLKSLSGRARKTPRRAHA